MCAYRNDFRPKCEPHWEHSEVWFFACTIRTGLLRSEPHPNLDEHCEHLHGRTIFLCAILVPPAEAAIDDVTVPVEATFHEVGLR